MATCCNKFVFNEVPDTFQMWQGLRGPYFTPHVAENGDLSWSNNGQLPNPETVNIKGPPGPGGVPGGTTGQLLAKASDEDYDTEWIDPPDLDAGHVEYDPAETYDDGSVGKELGTINSALSSLESVTQIIDTASGAIASFPDGSGLPMRSLVAQINPVQDLHGYDAPWPAGGGKNKIDEDTVWASFLQSDGSFLGRGGDVSPIKYYIPSELVGTKLTFSAYIKKPSGSSISNIMVEATAGGSSNTGNLVNSESYTLSKVTFTPTATSDYVRIAYGDGSPENLQFKDVQLEAGSSRTTFAPYSNICPISGWTGLEGEVAGVNLFDIKSFATMYPDLCSYDESTGELSVSKTDNILFNTGVPTIIPADKIDGGAYISCVAKNVTATNVRIRVIFEDGTAKDTTGTGTATNWTNIGGQTLRKRIVAVAFNWTQAGTFIIKDLQINFGATASDYEKYQGEAISVSWQDEAGTVYGGTDEVVGGNLTSTMKSIDLGTLTYTAYNSANGRIFYARVADKKNNTDMYCSALEFAGNYNGTGAAAGVIPNPSIAGFNSTTSTDRWIYIRWDEYETAAEIKTALSGVQLVYELAEPQEIALTPTQISTLFGQNNVWNDANGDTTVTYQASIKGYIDKVLGA